MTNPRQVILKRLFRIVRNLTLSFLIVSINYVIFLKFFPPLTTLLMEMRCLEKQPNKDGSKYHFTAKWSSSDELSKNIKLAAVASEDGNYPFHYGFDFDAMSDAFQHNLNSKKTIGGSTISQQVAKNVFLFPQRSYIRKAFETYFTALIELIWGKKRIIEMYLNIAETGNGCFGVEAASQKYYHKTTSQLNKYEAASLIALLPSPRKFTPNAYKVKLKANKVVIAMNKVGFSYIEGL